MKTLRNLFTALLLLCSITASAHDFEVDGIYYDITDYTNNTVKVTFKGDSPYEYYDRYTGHVVIPESVTCNETTYSVTSIGDHAFRSCSRLASVTIPNSVTSIGDVVFAYCYGLTRVTIGNGVTSIGGNAFYDCSSLASVVIGNSVTSIGENAFKGCSALASVVIPNSVTSIEGAAFSGCSGLTSVEIPNGVTSIGNEAFYGAIKAVFDITAETPATLDGSNVFASSAALVVPDEAVGAYKAAWSNYAAQIAGKNDVCVTVDAEAKDGTSGIMEEIGLAKVGSVVKLTVKGSINSYDVILFRDKMPLLRELDLSETTVVASDHCFYDGNCTKDNDFGNYVFYGLSNLNFVKLPKDLVAIGDYAFSGCSSLRELEIPQTVSCIGNLALEGCGSLARVQMPDAMQVIGIAAFLRCSSLKSIVVPKGVKYLPGVWFDGTSSSDWALFGECHALESVILHDGLEGIGERSFWGCSNLKEIKLPPTVKTIDPFAFNGCLSLEEIRIPSSVQSIGNEAFNGCANLNKVYTYTVEPTAIKENTFCTFATATLYVPSFSFYNYYWDEDGWKRFLNLEEFDEPYEYFYVNNDYVLNDSTGYIKGSDGNAPDADINAGGGFIVEGEQGDEEEPNQNLGDVNVGCDVNGNSGSIIGDNNLHIDDLHIKINVTGGRWYFFAFPFDIWFDNISMENGSDYVFRYYDGEKRATSGSGGWKDINENHLKAARGYIFQCSANDVLVLNIKDVKFKKEDKYNELVAHVSENLKDASWNFVGNPYLSYYDMADMDYTAPVTVWDGEKYVAIRPGDDDYHFAPYEAFFVQKPEGQDEIAYDGEEQMTQKQSNSKAVKQSAARRARGVNPDRLLINLVLDNGTSNDRTRIVFNEQQSLAYETACDASKFETKGVAQLYTIGRDNVHYAINERPADNGVVMLGYTAPTAGFYTIEAQRMDAEVFVKDYKTGELHNLNDGAYSFSTDAGTFNERFEILLKGTAPGTTGIEDVNGENGNVKTVYDLQGRKMQDAGKGIYIIGGEKVVK
ncbi:MAG: leucine-rich repeat domain-containing protein [Bacteroidaceae bacterium]|nr:leucine-rich repeat domain-containing protein [Bacteroidaceae bacterium]